ncbi:CRISPR-associated protein Csm3 [Rhabdobacter roseus]|uniref:CRISPR system Cms endoribonuclease Csm3 n=1 Tax=Rhabdobacter roseus TaxID=1655419 RepID=A0A840U1I8_9BACT|nr:type III-A CRISPR-associated RAMP protein Csm3 [Rhabdobacter roseus]MBB5287453.1 CRISPR-associated protein Csm3 [Rhabdobacter roseus]
MKLYKKIILKGTLKLLTGLHIGDSKENVEIGGVDSPVVRRKDNNEPYIPGSSLKGKIRSLLELTLGENADTKFKTYRSVNGMCLADLFGSADNPARILVRDASLTSTSSQMLKASEFTDMPYTEIKFENVINRLNGTAEHPRQIERVPAGAEFNIEFIINVIQEQEETQQQLDSKANAYLQLLSSGIELLHHDYLGGSGTRGYGQVLITLTEPLHKTAEEYLNSAVS